GALTGLVPGAVGVLAAWGAVHAIVYELHRLGARVQPPGYPGGAAVAVALGAAVVSVGAVLAPALSASGVSPLEALRTSATTASRRGIGWLRLVFGLLLALASAGTAGLVLASIDPKNHSDDPLGRMFAVVLSGTLAFGALIALGPILIRPVLRVVGWPVRRTGPVGALAVSGVGGAPRRAAAVSVVVALGATLIGGTLVGAASLRSLVEGDMSAAAPADVNVAAADGTVLPAGLADRLRHHGEFSRVVPYRGVNATADGRQGSILAVDIDVRTLPSARAIGTADGSLAAVAPGAVAVGAAYAQDAGRRVGDTIRLTAGGHTVNVRVVAVLAGAGPLYADVVADRSDLYGLVGSALGLALGVPYAWLMLLALGLDAPLQLRVPAVQLGALVAALATLTALAGLLPAWRAARLSPVAALGPE